MTWAAAASAAAAALVLVGLMAIASATTIGTLTGRVLLVSVSSDSMEPALRPGDLVVARPTEAADVLPGDVVIFHEPLGGRRIVHRVVEIDSGAGERPRTAGLPSGGPYLRTSGDANATPDPWVVTGDTELWRLHRRYRALGFLRSVLDGGLGPTAGLVALWGMAGVVGTIARRKVLELGTPPPSSFARAGAGRSPEALLIRWV